jgi:hypothetical protein
MRLYLFGAIGRGRMPGEDRERFIWFRDLFPERAAILDALFPSFSSQQLKEIEAAIGRQFSLTPSPSDVRLSRLERSERLRRLPLHLDPSSGHRLVGAR